MEKPICPKCRLDQTVKNGCVQKAQRWKCRHCSFQFTRSMPRGKPLLVKLLAVLLYRLGMTLQGIGGLFGVSDVAVLKWLRQIPLPENAVASSQGEVVILDEMWPYLQKNKTLFRSEKHWVLCRTDILPESVGVIILPR